MLSRFLFGVDTGLKGWIRSSHICRRSTAESLNDILLFLLSVQLYFSGAEKSKCGCSKFIISLAFAHKVKQLLLGHLKVGDKHHVGPLLTISTVIILSDIFAACSTATKPNSREEFR